MTIRRAMRRLTLGVLSALNLTLAAQAGQILHRPLEGEPESLDPQLASSGYAVGVLGDLFVGLIALDGAGRPVPGIAERWEISPDGKEWTFHLRTGARWSDGTKLTSADFLYSFRRLVTPATAASDPSDLAQVVGYKSIVDGDEKDPAKLGVEAPDPATLVVHLTRPRLFLRDLLTDPQLFPLPQAAIERWGKDWTRPGRLVSDGPFVLKEWTPHSEIVLVRNPSFYDAAAVRLDEVRWSNAEDMEAALRRFRAGELDWVDCTQTTIAICRQATTGTLHVAATNALTFMPINMTKGPLAGDARLREALNLATDRAVIVDKVAKLDQQAAYAVTPPLIPDYTAPVPPFAALSMPERIAKAQALMQAAGYGPDHRLAVRVAYATRETAKQMLVAIAAMWRQIYVDVTLENMEYQAFQSRLDARDYEIGLMGSIGSYDDYEDGLDNFRSDAGDSNWTGYKSARFDDAFSRGSASLDATERRSLMQQAEATLLDDFPLVPIAFDTRHRLVNPKLRGVNYAVVFPQSRYISFAN